MSFVLQQSVQTIPSHERATGQRRIMSLFKKLFRRKKTETPKAPNEFDRAWDKQFKSGEEPETDPEWVKCGKRKDRSYRRRREHTRFCQSRNRGINHIQQTGLQALGQLDDPMNRNQATPEKRTAIRRALATA